MSERPCHRCALEPGITVCGHCLWAVVRGDIASNARWIAFGWAVATSFAAAGLMVLLHAYGFLAWSLAVMAIVGAALIGAVLTEQRSIHPLALEDVAVVDDVVE